MELGPLQVQILDLVRDISQILFLLRLEVRELRVQVVHMLLPGLG